MSQLDDINSEIVHSAISTWSGFVYQGKVALYQTLKILNDVAAANNYSLQLDSLEDFAIIHNQVIKSIHQVKAVIVNMNRRLKIWLKNLSNINVMMPSSIWHKIYMTKLSLTLMKLTRQ